MDWSKYAGKSYRPSNSTEGEMFMEDFCYQCVHDWEYQQTMETGGCEILAKTMAFNIDDEEYPKEWVRDNKGYPKCTKFKKVNF
jgi:hypothetical protein